MKVKLSLRQVRVGALILALLLISFGVGFKLGKSDTDRRVPVFVDRNQPNSKKTIDMGLYWQVWDKLNETYLIKEDFKPQEMVWGAIRGMTAALGDPYTVFLPPEQNKATMEELNGTFEGVGIQLGFKEDRLAVIAPLSGMPAEAMGVKAGDLILHIKDEEKGIDVDTTDMSLPEAVKIIRGKKGTQVELTLLHDNQTETSVVNITRGTIVIKSVDLKWVGDDERTAHLILSRFGGRTDQEWRDAVREIENRNPEGIILDLRNNPGGYLQGAVEYAGEFLDVNKIVVKQENAQNKIETYSVSRKGNLKNYPLVVLINGGSASSSEILAGALRDHGRAKLVGTKSFGKGTVQEAIDLGDGAGLHVTTAKWLLPSGLWINESEGLDPDIQVESDLENGDEDKQLQKALEVLLNK